uniref:M2.BsrBI n=1 Tax=Geobacillus stearothermophilus TaxID=1422 RepID=E5Q8U5_GEOSE|nr:M2.BsrBI [Geobacillus stearothermophilus]
MEVNSTNTTNRQRIFYLSADGFKRDKDFVRSPLRYPGGKYYALKYIMPFLNCVPHDEYREPFLGGGNVFFAKKKSPINWLNDLESDLIELYKVIADSELRSQLINMVSTETASRERHEEIKNMVPNSTLEIAFRTYYLNRTSYSGIINKPAWGYAEGKSSPPQNWPKLLEPAGKKLSNVKITCKDFEEVITAKPEGNTVLMYLDPPYYHADQKRAYTKPFSIEDHLRLAKLLKETNYLFCLSYDDCPEIRQLYSWAEIYELSWLYNTANIKGQSRKLGRELIITNYKVIQEELTLFDF